MIPERLKQLREEMGFNRKEIAQKLNLPYTTYVNYETGAREPGAGNLITFANFYNVSIDYILGNIENRNPDEGEQQSTPDDFLIIDGKLIKFNDLSNDAKKEYENFLQYFKYKYNL